MAVTMIVTGLTVPAGAVADTPAPSERAQVVALWQSGGPAMKEAAAAALTGSDEEVHTFLATGQAVGPSMTTGSRSVSY
ncbi:MULTISPECIES: ALF repeat-containing protein [Amycolatopsis]|uniref:ALF repeat-containing protein n=1 Tax=Amycolatopsis TaxID=1813 RepID=UPI0013047958|nr:MULTISPECIES: ALF repeat-containing protein [Amycolatopsis]